MKTVTVIATIETSSALAVIDRELERDPRLRSRNTKRGYRHDLAQFEHWRNHRPLSRLLVEEYASDLLKAGKAPAAVNRALAAIRWWARRVADLSFEDPGIDRAQREEIITQAARVASIEDVKNHGRPPAGRHVPIGEVEALMRACANDHSTAGTRDAAIIGLAAGTGLRRAEIAGLDLANVDLGDGEAVLTVTGKGDKTRIVNICNGAHAALVAWLGVRGDDPGPLFYAIHRGGHVQHGAGLSTEALAQMLAKRAKAAGITKPLTWHDFRRTVAGELLEATDIVTVQKILGHVSPSTTARYDRRPDEARRRALQSRHVPYYGRGLA